MINSVANLASLLGQLKIFKSRRATPVTAGLGVGDGLKVGVVVGKDGEVTVAETDGVGASTREALGVSVGRG